MQRYSVILVRGKNKQKGWRPVRRCTHRNPENVRFGSLADMFDGMKTRALYR
jgi:hypothetical protein